MTTRIILFNKRFLMLKKISLIHKDSKQLVQKTTSFQMKFVEFKATEDGKIRIKGFASTPDIDRYDDIVNPVAFANAMTNYMKNPVVLLGHSTDDVLGQVIEYNLSPAGLEITAELSNDIENTFKNIIDKNLRGFSIGFICKAANYREESTGREIREITDLDLVEISVVATPANANSLFTLAKSLKNFFGEQAKMQAEQEEKEKDSIPMAHCKSCEGGDCEGEDGEIETAHCKGCKGEECKGCGKPKKSIEEVEKKDIEEVAKENPKTDEEVPAGETPATQEIADASALDNNGIVKVDDTPADKQEDETAKAVEALSATVAELKALIETDKTKTETLLAEQKGMIEKQQDAFLALAKSYQELEQKHTALEVSHKQVESDLLKIPVKNIRAESKSFAQARSVTDDFVMKTIGMR